MYWLSIALRIQFKMLILVNKDHFAILVSQYIPDMISLYDTSRCFQSQGENRHLVMAFNIHTPEEWNSLLVDLRYGLHS